MANATTMVKVNEYRPNNENLKNKSRNGSSFAVAKLF